MPAYRLLPLALLLASGCGQRGDLYLPPTDDPAGDTPAAAAAAAGEKTIDAAAIDAEQKNVRPPVPGS